MGRLTDTANERIKANRDASLPEWVPILGAVALVALLAWALISSFVGGNGATADGGAPAPAVLQPRPGANPGRPGPGGGRPAAATSTTEPSAVIELPNATGGFDSVPAAAAELARAVATARVRGDVSNIPLVDGAAAQTIAQMGDRPEIIEVTSAATEGDRYSFVVTVDPDGAGPAPSTYLSVVVVSTGIEWRWDPAG